jgi:hypothetical protein
MAQNKFTSTNKSKFLQKLVGLDTEKSSKWALLLFVVHYVFCFMLKLIIEKLQPFF